MGRASRGAHHEHGLRINPLYAGAGEIIEVDRFTLPPEGMDRELAFGTIHDEVMLDGNARLNLATFVGTWMDEYAMRLYMLTADKNMIDKDEYPKTAEIEDRCWKIIADLWNAPDPQRTIGTSTIGSSEACMLAGLAFKRRWQQQRRAAGLSTEKPNLIMSAAVQVVWEKFCNYWDVEPRYVPVTAEHPVLDGHDLADYVDENTIGVVAIMGETYRGIYEPVQEIAAALDEIQESTGLDIPVHVDGASGGFVAPFLQPDLVWDFRLERVHSISASGHKYGLVYPGIGWVVWRTREAMPEDLIFHVSYLGGDMPTLALNFSRPGAQVLLQYYLFLRLGFEGYRTVQQESQDVAVYLSTAIGAMPAFELLSHGTDIPVFAWKLADGHTTTWNLHHLSDRLRMRGWQVPAYPMPDDLSDVTVQRIVVRNGVTMDLASDLLKAIEEETAYLEGLSAPMPSEAPAPAFHH